MAAAIALAVSVVFSIWAFGGPSGFLYVAVVVLATVPGLPLGFALFGRRHFGGWLAGFLLGYGVTTLACWVVIVLQRASASAFVAAWLVTCLLTWLATRRVTRPAVQLPPWTARESAALVLLLLTVPALMTRPFVKLGAVDASGNHLYRAYFIADFVWHTALTAELAKDEARPRNPFLASEPVHYYWTYFRLPATIAAQTGVGVEDVLKLNAFLTAFALIASVYFAAWAALPSWPFLTAIAVALTVLCPSAEGLAAIADVVRRGLPLSEVRDLNIDAVAAWALKGLRIDNLPRTMWYTPQHGLSCALGLLAVPVAIAGGLGASSTAILLAGCALAISVAMNPLLGGVFCAVYGLTILADAFSGPPKGGHYVRQLLRHGLAALPVVAALAWCVWNEVGEGAGSALHFGFWGLARNAPVRSFALQFGPILIPIAVALWPPPAAPSRSLWPAVIGLVLALFVMHFIALTVDTAWVGFRGGNVFFALAPALVASGLARLWSANRRQAALLIVTFVVLAGLPTTVIDAYNTQDVTNLHFWRDAERVRGVDVPIDPATEYRWTLVITPEEWEALTWIRTNTPLDATVQAESVVRGRETWSLIPTFGERRMATGNPLPLLARPIYSELNERVKTIYASSDARAAWQDARALGIDYLYVDKTERTAYPAVSKFDANREFFSPVFRNREAAVYAVRR